MTRPAPENTEPGGPPADEAGPGGPFRSWRALYATVVVWSLTLILLLYLFTVFLNVETAAP